MDKKSKKCKKGTRAEPNDMKSAKPRGQTAHKESSQTVSAEILKTRVDQINQSLKKSSIDDDDKVKKCSKNERKKMKLIKVHIDNSKNEKSNLDNHVSDISQNRISRSEQSRPIGKRSSSIPVRKNLNIDANIPSVKPNCQKTKRSNSIQRPQSQHQKVDSENQFSNAQIDQVSQQKKSKIIPLIDEMSQLSISNRENPIIRQLGRGKSMNLSSAPIQSSNLKYKNIQTDKSDNLANSLILKSMAGRGKRLNNLTPKKVDQIKIEPDPNLPNLSSIETTPDIVQHSTNSELKNSIIDESFDNKLQQSNPNLNNPLIQILAGRGKRIKPEIKKFQNLSEIKSESSQNLIEREKLMSETNVNQNFDIKLDSKIISSPVQNIELPTEKKSKFKFLRPSAKENKDELPKSEKIQEISKNKTEEISVKILEIQESFNVQTRNKCTEDFDHVKNWLENVDTPSLLKSSSSSSLSSTDQPEINKLSTSFESNISDEETDELQESVLAIESLERLKRVDGLLHGNIQVKLVTTFDDLPLNSLIQNNLGLKKITNLSRCQVFSIPVVLEKRNFVLVGLPKSKKTTSYVVPLLNNLLDEEYYSQLKDGNGPRGVILVPNAQRVRHVASLCSSFSGARLNIITTHGGGLELERKDELTNGCDLLISTPRCWLRLLKIKHVTNILRICHIVFDSFDDLSSLFLEELMLIYGMITDLEKYRKTNSIIRTYQIQKVFVGQTWNSVLETIFFKFLENPVLCITAHLEAAVYAKINPKLIITEKDDKIQKLTELINNNDSTKTVVICNTANEVKKIRQFLSSSKVNIIFAHEDMHPSLVQEAKNSWMCHFDKSMLICSDEVVMELAITNADWLIHYTIPEHKSLFSDRFCVLKEHFSDRLLNPNVGAVTCKVHLLVDNENEIQFPELLRFIELFSSQKLSDLKNAVEKIKESKERNKTGVLFCDNLLQFGNCWKQQNCQKQHVIDLHRDKPCIYQKGHILFKLICVHSTTCFSARIISITENINIADISETKWEPFQSNYSQIGLMMMKCFRDVEKRHLHGRPKVGDKIAAQKPGTFFFSRGQILAITGRNDKFDPTEVLVWFMDDGPEIKMKVEDIYELPQAVYNFPPQTVNLYVANLQPIDLDVNWSYVSTKTIKRNLNRLQTDHKSLFHIGKIELVIGSNVIIDDFCSYERLEVSQCYVTRFSIKNLMLKSGMALYSPKHVKSLKDLCVKGCLFEPEVHDKITVEKIETEKVSTVKEKWAHLPKDELVQVNITCIHTPSLFFVQIIKFRSMLDNLLQDLSKALEKNANPLKLIKIGSLCTVKNEEQDEELDKQLWWNRASVTKIFSDSLVQVLLVDLGYTMNKDVCELFIIPETFITRLPFQAIECKLDGITPFTKWTRESSDFLRSISQNENFLKNFYLKVCDIKLKAYVTNGRHYSVILARTDNIHSFINNEMVSNQFAQRNHLTKSYLDEDWTDEILNNHDLTIQDLSPEDAFEEFIKNFDFEICRRTEVDDKDLPPPDDDDDDDLPPPIHYDQKCTNVSNITDESEDESKSSLSETQIDNDIPQLVQAIKYYTPKVFWRENDFYVWIQIMVPEVKVYEIRYNQEYLTFQAHINEKMYWISIDFFGLTKRSGFEYKITGQYVAIRLEKMFKYHPWIRLTYLDSKYPHIKINPEHGLHDFIKNASDHTDYSSEYTDESDVEPERQSESDCEFGIMSYEQEEFDPLS